MRKKHQITPEQKTRILKDLLQPDSSVTKISRACGVSREMLYKWRRQHGFDYGCKVQAQKAVGNNSAGNFVELSVKESGPILQRVSLVFDNFSVSIEGRISGSKLLGILKVLGKSC